MKKILVLFAASCFFLGMALILQPSPAYAINNNLVISDNNFTDSGSMNATDINNFLASKSSWLANYTIPEYIDVPYPTSGGLQTVSVRQYYDAGGVPFYNKSVAQLIYEEAREHSVSPKVILTTLQKESSAVTRSQPSSGTTQAWPMFYGYNESMADCFNTGNNCNDSAYRDKAINLGGVGQQIAYAAAWFGNKYSYYSGSYSSPISIDGMTITCGSLGTRVLYTYTPHVQTSFYNIWSNWWGDPAPTASTTSVAVYRFWSPVFQKHFYTANDTEKNNIISSDPNWRYEGLFGYASNCGNGSSGPVYRFWSPTFSGAHFYTSNEEERGRISATDPNWRYEGVVFCAGGGGQVHRFWSSRFRSHFFTTSGEEKNNIINSDPNWFYEGVAFNIIN